MSTLLSVALLSSTLVGWFVLFVGSFVSSTLLLSSGITVSFSTVTVDFATFCPSSVITDISTVPSATPVTTPFWVTVAIFSSLETHFKFLFVAFSGLIVAISVTLFPTTILLFIGVTLTPVTLTVVLSSFLLSSCLLSSFFVSSVGLEFCDFFTVIFASALLFPLSVIAVIVTFPSFIPVTIPFSTVAILSLLEIHFTFLFATPSGFTSAVSIAFSPTS